MRRVFCGMGIAVLVFGGSGACGAEKAPPAYSLHEVRQAAVMPDDTVVELHALVWQGEHGLILEDEKCGDRCNDVVGLEVPDAARASFDAAAKRVGYAIGCCNDRKAYFDMIVKLEYLDHHRSPADHDPRPVRRLSQAVLVRVVSAAADTPPHWLATHR